MQNTEETNTGANKRRAARIDQILDAAAACFVEYGFHGAGMAKIAKHAGMSVGHIYHYFESKEAIIAAIVDQESELAAERFAELEAVPKEDLVRVMTSRAANMTRKKTEIFQSVLNMEILAECQRNPQIAEIVRRHDEEIRCMFRTIIRDKLGLQDADARTDILLSLLGGMGARMLRNPGLDHKAVIPLLEDMMRYVLEPQKERAKQTTS